MPAIDHCEPQIIRALEKDGWRVVRKHFPIHLGKHGGFVFADLRLQKGAALLMILEMKCLDSTPFPLDDFYLTVGQYLLYQNALQLNAIEEPLYLALPNAAYRHCVALPAIHSTLTNAKIRMVIIDLETEEIVQWIH